MTTAARVSCSIAPLACIDLTQRILQKRRELSIKHIFSEMISLYLIWWWCRGCIDKRQPEGAVLPGPCDYEIHPQVSNGPAYSFGEISKVRTAVLEVPGPGDYESIQTTFEGPSFSIPKASITRQSLETAPGPGEYARYRCFLAAFWYSVLSYKNVRIPDWIMSFTSYSYHF